MLHEILHVMEHAVIDTVKMLPFLYLAYLLIEYIERRHAAELKKPWKAVAIGDLFPVRCWAVFRNVAFLPWQQTFMQAV